MDGYVVFWWLGPSDPRVQLQDALIMRHVHVGKKCYQRAAYMKQFVAAKQREGYNVLVRKRELSRHERMNMQNRWPMSARAIDLLTLAQREELV